MTGKLKKKANVKPFNLLPGLVGFMLFLAAFFGIGIAVMGDSFAGFAKAFCFVFVIAVLAYLARPTPP